MSPVVRACVCTEKSDKDSELFLQLNELFIWVCGANNAILDKKGRILPGCLQLKEAGYISKGLTDTFELHLIVYEF